MAVGFAETLRRHSKEVIRLEGAHADEFLRLLRETREQLLGKLSANTSDNPIDAFRLKAILGDTEASIRALELKAIGKWGRAASQSLELAVGHIEDEMAQLSKAFDAKPLDVALDAQRVLSDPAQGLLANHYETSVRRYGLDLLNQARQRVFIGLRTGDTTRDIARSIGSKTGPLGAFGEANAERIVRTEISQAYGEAHAAGLRQTARKIPGLKKVWLHVGSYPCPVCMPLHGTERPLDGTWTIRSGSKTKEVAHPPGHPNCTCRVASMKPSWRSGLKRLGYLDTQDEKAPSAL